MKSLSVLTLLVLCMSACSSRPDTAQDTFKQYLRHVYLNQDEQAWELLAPEDREQFVTLKSKLEATGSAHALAIHETLLVRAIVNPYAIKSVKMLEDEAQQAHVATLEYELVDGRQGTAKMVRHDEQWFLKILP